MRQNLVQEAWSRTSTNDEPFEDILKRAGQFILATERHRLTLSTALMVLLDLADFLDTEVSRANSAMLRKEAEALRNWDETTWMEKTGSYLAEFSAALAHGIDAYQMGAPAPVLPPALQEQIRAVRAGVDRVAEKLRIAKSLGRAGQCGGLPRS